MADHSAEIARIESILNSGAETVVVDGVTTRYDFDMLRQRLRDLIAADDDATVRRPRVSSIDLGGSW